MSGPGWHRGRGRPQSRRWTCRGCGREPGAHCWYCRAMICTSCTTEDPTACDHCRRPLRGVTARSVVTAMIKHAWGLRYGAGLFGDRDRRNHKRARRRGAGKDAAS